MMREKISKKIKSFFKKVKKALIKSETFDELVELIIEFCNNFLKEVRYGV